MVHATKLCVHFQGDIGEILVLFSSVIRLVQLHMNGMDTKLDIANALIKLVRESQVRLEIKSLHLDPRIYEVITILQKNEDETRFLVVF